MKMKVLRVTNEGYYLGDKLFKDVELLVKEVNESEGCLIEEVNMNDYEKRDLAIMKVLIDKGISRGKLYVMKGRKKLSKELIETDKIVKDKFNLEYDIDENNLKICRLGTNLLWIYYTVIDRNSIKVRENRNKIIKEYLGMKKEYFKDRVGKEYSENFWKELILYKKDLSIDEERIIIKCIELEEELIKGENMVLGLNIDSYPPMFISTRSQLDIRDINVYLPNANILPENKYYTINLNGNFSETRYYTRESVLDFESRLLGRKIDTYTDIRNSVERFKNYYKIRKEIKDTHGFEEYAVRISDMINDLLKNEGVFITELLDHISISFSNNIPVYKALDIIREILDKHKDVGYLFEYISLNRRLPEKIELRSRELENSNRALLVSDLSKLKEIRKNYKKSQTCDIDIINLFKKLKES